MSDRTTKSSRFEPILWDDIRANLNTRWLIKGVLPRHGQGMIYGATGSGKTFEALDISAHIGLGFSWRGLKVERAGIVYFACEGRDGIKNRIEAFKRRFCPTVGDVPFMVLPAGLDLCSRDGDTDEIIKMIKEAEKKLSVPVGLVLVDTLSAAMAGGEENTSKDMGAYVKNTGRIAEATGAFVLSVHHCGKDEAKGARGHSLLKAAMDFESEVVNANGLRTMTVTKQRDGESGQTFSFRLEKVELGKDADGDIVDSCVCVPVDGAVAKPSKDKKPKALTDDQKNAFKTLADLIAKRGEPAPGFDDFPAGAVVVSVESWRKALRSRHEIDEGDKGRQQFKRIKDTLKARGKIGIEQDLVWIVPERDA